MAHPAPYHTPSLFPACAGFCLRQRFLRPALSRIALAFSLLLLAESATPAQLDSRVERPAAANGAVQNENVRALERGQTIEREIDGAERHAYRIALARGQFLRAVVEQRGVNVALTLFGPQGDKLAEADRSRTTQGTESLSVVAESAGDYRLEVRASETDVAAAGRYEARIAEAREATTRDRSRAAAERMLEEARRRDERLPLAESHRKSIEKYEAALKLWRDVGERAEEAETLERLGVVHYYLSQYQKALEYHEQSRVLWHAMGDRAGEGRALRQIGEIYVASGEYQRALEHYDRSLALHRAAEDRQGEADVILRYGWAYWRMDEYQKALEFFVQSLALYQTVGDRFSESGALYSVGLIYWTLGEYHKSLEAYGKALSFHRANGDRHNEMRTLDNMGLVYHALGEHQKALECYAQSLPYRREAGLRSLEADTLTGIGTVYASLDENQKALEYLTLGLAVYREVGNRTGESYAHRNIGHVHVALKEPHKAIVHYQRAIALDRALGERSSEARARAGLAHAQRDAGELIEARAHVEAALNIVESLRSKLASQDLRASYFASKRSYYEFYIDLLMRLHERRPADGYDAAALQASERARARSLLDLLAEAKVDVQQGIAPELKRREQDLQARISLIQSGLIKALSQPAPDKSKVAALEEELKKVESAREQLTSEIRRKHPRYAEINYPTPLPLTAIQKLLDQQTALLEYTLGQDGSFLFVVSRDDVRSYRLPPAAEIRRLVGEVRAGLEQPGRREFGRYAQAARRLYDALIAPAAAALKQKQRLLIAPDGALHYLPFEVLLTTQPNSVAPKDLDYLLKRWAVSYVPSASVLDGLRRNGAEAKPVTSGAARKEFVAFADPVYEPEAEKISVSENKARQIARSIFEQEGRWNLRRLKDSGREVNAIAATFKADERAVYLGTAATEENVKSNEHIGHARLIHFATHGLTSERQPQYSGLALTLDEDAREDGLLQVYEIFNLKLNAELVTLSACRTGLGKEVRGEGLIGLTRAFLYAGASSVVVSLWQVGDESTADLMVQFYRQMNEADKSEALRRAKLKMIQDGRYAHPYHWAPFVLVGEPK